MTTPRDALKELGVHYLEAGAHHHATAGWVSTDCPKCSPGSGRYRLGYNLTGGYLSCWVCGRLPLGETLSLLSGRPPREVWLLFKGVEKTFKPPRARGKLELPEGLVPLMGQHRSYLEGRGFDADELRGVWKLKGIDHRGGPVAWRVFVPVHVAGQIVSWTARATDPEARVRYKNALPSQEAEPMHGVLYGADHVRHGVIVHEGPADVWRTGPGAVALMGLNCSPQQLSKLASCPVRVVCLDAEDGAQRRARRLCELLAPLPGATHNVVLDAKDAGEASEREINLLRGMIR